MNVTRRAEFLRTTAVTTKGLLPCGVALVLTLAGGARAAQNGTLLKKVSWLGHAAIRIEGSATIYIDPYDLKRPKGVADLVLITHDHDDHFSAGDIDKVKGERTVIVGPASVVARLSGKTMVVEPGKTLTVGKVAVRAVPACNVGKPYHPCDSNHVGYVLRMDGSTYYHAGDTDRVPGMKGIRADVAFLPVTGAYTMDAAEAAHAATDIKPKVTIPIHWGSVIGSRDDAVRFKDLCRTKVEILGKVD